MNLSAVICVLCFGACNGLFVPPEAADEGRRFGQTDAAHRQRIEAQGSIEAMSESMSHHRMESVASREEAQVEGRMHVVADSMMREGAWLDRQASEIIQKQRIMAGREAKRKDEDRSLRLGTERQKQKEVEKAEYTERVAQREEEKRLAQEEWEAAQKFRAAQRVVEEKRNAEHAYQHSLVRLEMERTSQLWKQAEGVRAEAEQGQLRKDAIEQLLGGSLEKVATDLVGGLVLAASNAHFRTAVSNLRQKPFPANFMEGIKHKAEAFVIASESVNEQQFVPMLAKFLNESQQDLRRHEEAMASVAHSLNANAPKQLKENLALILGNITVSSTLINVDTHHLARSNSSDACSTLAHTLTEAAPQYPNFTQMKEVLDMTSKMVPQMVSEFPKTKYEVAPMANALLNMAYVEHIALEEATTAFISRVAPIIASRLHCSFSGAVAHVGLRLSMVTLSMVASWLTL